MVHPQTSFVFGFVFGAVLVGFLSPIFPGHPKLKPSSAPIVMECPEAAHVRALQATERALTANVNKLIAETNEPFERLCVKGGE